MNIAELFPEINEIKNQDLRDKTESALKKAGGEDGKRFYKK